MSSTAKLPAASTVRMSPSGRWNCAIEPQGGQHAPVQRGGALAVGEGFDVGDQEHLALPGVFLSVAPLAQTARGGLIDGEMVLDQNLESPTELLVGQRIDEAAAAAVGLLEPQGGQHAPVQRGGALADGEGLDVGDVADRKNRGTFRGTTPRRVQESPAVPACEDAGDKPPGRR